MYVILFPQAVILFIECVVHLVKCVEHRVQRNWFSDFIEQDGVSFYLRQFQAKGIVLDDFTQQVADDRNTIINFDALYKVCESRYIRNAY